MRFTKFDISSFKMLSLAAGLALGVAGSPAFAQTVGGNAHDIEAHISVIGLINLDVTPVANTTMPPSSLAFSGSDIIPSLADGTGIASVDAGVLEADVDYAPDGSSFVAGSLSSVASVAVDALGLLGTPLISINANQIVSSVIVEGYCSVVPRRAGHQTNDLGSDEIHNFLFDNGFDSQTLTPQIAVEMPGLAISILNTQVTNLPSDPPPNTAVDLQTLGIVGATLILNEQNRAGDGTTSMTSSNNAVHLTLNVAGVITADVVLGHSDLSVNCPE